MEAVAEIKDIWYLVIGLVTLVAWSVRLESIVKDNKTKLSDQDHAFSEHIKANKREQSAAWTKLDEMKSDLALVERATNIHSGMLKPENLERHHIETTEFKTATKYRLDHLEKLLSDMRKNGGM